MEAYVVNYQHSSQDRCYPNREMQQGTHVSSLLGLHLGLYFHLNPKDILPQLIFRSFKSKSSALDEPELFPGLRRGVVPWVAILKLQHLPYCALHVMARDSSRAIAARYNPRSWPGAQRLHHKHTVQHQGDEISHKLRGFPVPEKCLRVL